MITLSWDFGVRSGSLESVLFILRPKRACPSVKFQSLLMAPLFDRRRWPMQCVLKVTSPFLRTSPGTQLLVKVAISSVSVEVLEQYVVGQLHPDRRAVAPAGRRGARTRLPRRPARRCWAPSCDRWSASTWRAWRSWTGASRRRGGRGSRSMRAVVLRVSPSSRSKARSPQRQFFGRRSRYVGLELRFDL